MSRPDCRDPASLPREFRSLRELHEWIAAYGTGRAMHMRIEHDAGCSPIACRCAPTYYVERLTVETYAAAGELHRRWAREVLS